MTRNRNRALVVLALVTVVIAPATGLGPGPPQSAASDAAGSTSGQVASGPGQAASGPPLAAASATQVDCADGTARFVAEHLDAADRGDYGAATAQGFLADKADNIDSPSNDMRVDLLADYIDRNFDVGAETRDATARLVGETIDAHDKPDACWVTAGLLVDFLDQYGDAVDDESTNLTTSYVVYLLELVAGRVTPTGTPTASPTSTPVDECPTTEGVETRRVRVEESDADDPESLDGNGDGWICVHVGDDGGMAWTDNDDGAEVDTPSPQGPDSPTPSGPSPSPPPESPSPESPSPSPPPGGDGEFTEPPPWTFPPGTFPPPPTTTTGGPSWEGFDFGDAPDRPYPSTRAEDGSRHRNLGVAWLGGNVSGEPDSRQVNRDSFDDGLAGTSPVTVEVTNRNHSGPLYVNVLIDVEENGDWEDPGEWAVRNREVSVDPGETETVQLDITWTSGPFMRVTLTGEPVDDYDGTGAFAIGETEDYSIVHQSSAGGIPGFGTLVALGAVVAAAWLVVRKR